MCIKNSCEAGTEKVDKINTIARPLKALFYMFYNYSNIMALLNIFNIKHSKTECTVRSFGLTATCYLETSLVQGVHHAGVAVELGHMLKNIKRAMVFLTRLLINFTTYYIILAECSRIPFDILKLSKGLHHAGVAVKVEHSMVKFMDKIAKRAGGGGFGRHYHTLRTQSPARVKIIFCLSSWQDLAECNWNNPWLVSGSMMTSLARVLHHAGVAAMVDSWLMSRQMKKMRQMSMELYKKWQNPNFFLLWECYSYTRMSTWFGFCVTGSFPLDHVGTCRIFLISYSTSLGCIYTAVQLKLRCLTVFE
jgi:hypothetical protein